MPCRPMSYPHELGFLPIGHMLVYGFLPSWLKVMLYRLKGYEIGKGVSIGLGSVVVGEQVRIGDHTHLGFFDVVRGRKIDIGKHVSIGSGSFVRTADIEIGDGAVITEQVFIGGQEETEESRFKLGKNTVVMYMTFINTFRPVTIGDDSGVGGHCIIFSHGAWLSAYEGYPITYKAVEIGDGVWLPWRVFVMPGAKIGDGSVIGAGSLVSGEIPPHSLAVGSPAKVVKSDYPRMPSAAEKEKIFDEMVERLVRHFRFHRFEVSQTGNRISIHMTERRFLVFRKRIGGVVYVARDERALAELEATRSSQPVDVVLALCEIPPELRRELDRDDVMWLEIAKKQRSQRSFAALAGEIGHVVGRSGVRFDYVAD